MTGSQQTDVLLVEDHPGDIVLIDKMLRNSRFRLRHAEQLSQALEELSRPGIDIVLLDLSLPDSQGLATFTKLRTFAQEVPIVVISGLEDETVAIQAVHAGAQDYLIKGEINSSSLVRSLRYALERGGLERERTQLLIREQMARAAAEEAQQRFLDIVHSIEGIVWEADAQNFTFIFVSRQAERVLGYPIERWLEDRNFWHDHIYPDDREWAANYYIQCINEGRNHQFEYRMIAADGRVVWLRDMVTVVIENNQVSKLRGVMFDITDRKEAEKVLAAHAKRQAAVARLGQRALLTDDLQVLMDEAAQSVAETLGVEYCAMLELAPDGETFLFRAGVGWPEGLAGQTIVDSALHPLAVYTLHAAEPVIVTDLRSESRFDVLPLIHDRGIISGMSCTIPDPPDRSHGVLSVCTRTQPTFNQDDVRFLQAVASLLSNTLQRQRAVAALHELNATLERRVAERTAELEWRNRELDQFAYVASHDLKAPLRAIGHLATWISEDATDVLSEPSKEHLTKLRGRIKRMEVLLDDLLAYSRAARQRHSLEPVDITVLTQRIVESLMPPPGFTVTVSETIPVLQAEQIPLETVLRNLIGNAIKHHHRPEEGHVKIEAQEQEQWVVFTVRDNGPGIDLAFHERIFEMFQTLQPRDRVEGSGIGLAVVKKLVESRGGTIQVESTWGQGTSFHFTWPKVQSLQTI